MSGDKTPSNDERDQAGRTGEPYVYPRVEAANPGGPNPMPGGPNPLPEAPHPLTGDDPSPNPGGPDPEPGGPDPVIDPHYGTANRLPEGAADNLGGPGPVPGGPNPVPGSEVDHPVVRRVPVDDPSPNPGGPDPAPGGPNPVE